MSSFWFKNGECFCMLRLQFWNQLDKCQCHMMTFHFSAWVGWSTKPFRNLANNSVGQSRSECSIARGENPLLRDETIMRCNQCRETHPQVQISQIHFSSFLAGADFLLFLLGEPFPFMMMWCSTHWALWLQWRVEQDWWLQHTRHSLSLPTTHHQSDLTHTRVQLSSFPE